MKYEMPVRVYEEADCVRAHGSEMLSYGTKALVVTGRHSARACGAMDDVEAVLNEGGMPYVLFDEVEENPSLETVLKGRDLGLSQKVDFVIAIGGGSPMDAGKAIALMIAQPDWGISEMLTKTTPYRYLPVVAIPTTCGTGSEVTAVSVLTRHHQRTKGSIPYQLFPELALVDGKYLKTASLAVLQSTAVDALAHLAESYLHSSATDFSRIFAAEGLRAWGKNKEVLQGLSTPTEEDYRNLCYASVMGGMAIAHTGTSLPHALSYFATYEKGLAHGKACGYYLGGYLREGGETGQKTIPQLAGFADVEEMNAFVYKVCGLERLPEDLLTYSVDKLAANPAKLKSAPYPVDREVLSRIAGI